MDDQCTATEQGDYTFTVKGEDENEWDIDFVDIFYSPSITRNLCSLRKLTAAGAKILFDSDWVMVMNEEWTPIMTGREDETKLYRLHHNMDKHVVQSYRAFDKSVSVSSICKLTNNPTFSLQDLHNRFGHVAKDQIKDLIASGSLGDIKINDEAFPDCRICDQAKLTRQPFEVEKTSKALMIGDRIHSDVCGPLSTDSIDGKKYFVHFTDEYSDFSFIRTIRKKDEVFEIFQELRAAFETQLNRNIKTLICDGGGEYNSAEFSDFLKEYGIVHEVNPPHTPKRNGKSERLNRTLMGLARAMLRSAKLPNRFWGLAVEYAIYIRNRFVKPGSGKTRYELLTQKPAEYKHLHTFGAEVMVLDPREDKSKLADRGNAGIFVGVDVESYTYKIYLVKEKKVIRSRDVKFYSNKELDLIEDEEELTAEEENVNEEPFIPSTSSSPPDLPSTSTSPENYASTPTLTNSNSEVRDDYDSESEDELFDDLPVRSPPTNDHSPPIPPPITVHIPPIQEQTFRDPIMTRSRTTGIQIRSVVDSASSLGKIVEPTNLKEALASPHSQQWIDAMNKELESLQALKTWEVVDASTTTPSSTTSKQAVGSKWVYKVKYDENGEVERFKARLVAKGYSQIEGINYQETYAPTLNPSSLRYCLVHGMQNDFEIDHIDVETAFLYGELEEEVYMRLPEMCGDNSGKVVRLLRSLYGLKQASRCWNKKAVNAILEKGYTQSTADPCMFYRVRDNKTEILTLFVDDCLVMGKRESIDEVIGGLSKEFKLRNLGPVKLILGIKVDRTPDSISLSQSSYIRSVLTRFGMNDCKPASTPMPTKLTTDAKENLTLFDDVNLYQQLIGALIYISNNTRPDITYSVSVLARDMAKPTIYSYQLAKRVLRYLQGTINAKLTFNKNNNNQLVGYSDASYAENDDRKSTTGMLFVANGGSISWKSKKQQIVALSSMEAEYIALTSTAKEALWLRKIEAELKGRRESMIIHEDNQSAIKLASNSITNDRSKHIDVRYHFIRDRIHRGEINLNYIPTKFQLADLMTKGLPKDQHYALAKGMGLVF